MIEKENLKKYVAELLGTFALVLIGCGSAVIAGGNIGFFGISFAFGLTVLAMVYAIGPISGCHINPAITIAMLVAKKIESKDAMFYIAFQCVGAIIGAAVLLAIVSGAQNYKLVDDGAGGAEWAEYDLDEDGLGQNGYEDGSPSNYTIGAAFVAEVVLTFIFLLVIFGATSEKAPAGFAGIAIGLSLVFIHLIGIPVTGTSVNPARSLGPALFVGGDALSQLWLFWVAPIIGGAIAAFLWVFFFEESEAQKKEAKKEPEKT